MTAIQKYQLWGPEPWVPPMRPCSPMPSVFPSPSWHGQALRTPEKQNPHRKRQAVPGPVVHPDKAPEAGRPDPGGPETPPSGRRRRRHRRAGGQTYGYPVGDERPGKRGDHRGGLRHGQAGLRHCRGHRCGHEEGRFTYANPGKIIFGPVTDDGDGPTWTASRKR
jgi:hypothetical protein